MDYINQIKNSPHFDRQREILASRYLSYTEDFDIDHPARWGYIKDDYVETVVNLQRERSASKFLITSIQDPTKKGWNMELINTILSFCYYFYHGYGAISAGGFGSTSAKIILCVLSLGQCMYYLDRLERGVKAA